MRFRKNKEEAYLVLEQGWCGGVAYSSPHGNGEFCGNVKFK